MSGETIRDVQIRVSVVNGAMNLGAFNTSAAEASVNNLIEQTQQRLQGMMGSVSIAPSAAVSVPWSTPTPQQGTATPSTGPPPWNAAAVPANNSPSQFPMTVPMGMPGYGQSVRDRSFQAADEVLKQMHAGGHLDNATPQQIDQLHQKFSRQSTPLVRESDREGTKAGNAAQKDAEAAEKAAKKAEEADIKAMQEAFEYRKKFYQDREKLRDKDLADAEKAADREEQLQKRAQQQKGREDQSQMDKLVAKAVQRTSKEEKANKAAQEPSAGGSEEHGQSAGAMSRAYGHAARSAEMLAHGIALVAASSDKEAESMLRAVVAVEGYFNMIRGGIQLLQQLTAAQTMASAAQVAGAATSVGSAGVGAGAAGVAGAGTAATGAAAAGAGSATAGAATAMGGLTVATGGTAVALLAAVAALGVWRVQVLESRAITLDYFDVAIGKAHAMAEAVRSIGTAKVDFAVQDANINRGAASTGKNLVEQAKDRDIQNIHARMVDQKQNLSPEQKGTFKEVFSRERNFNSQQKHLKNQEADLKTKDEKLKGALGTNKEEAEKSHQAHIKEQDAIRDKKGHILRNPEGYRSVYNEALGTVTDISKGAGIGLKNMLGDNMFGNAAKGAGDMFAAKTQYLFGAPEQSEAAKGVGENAEFGGSTEQKEQLAQLNQDLIASETADREQQSAAAERTVDIEKQRLEVNEAILKNLAEQNKSVTEYQKETHAAAQKEREKDKSVKESVGSMSFGDLAQQKIIQDIFLRNEEKRKENKKLGREETFGFEKYTQHQIQIAAPGTAAHKGTQEQARGEADRYGIMSDTEYSGMLGETKRADEAAQKLNPEETEDKIKSKSDEIPGMVKEIEGSMKDALDMRILVDGIKAAFAEQKENFKQYVLEINSFFGT